MRELSEIERELRSYESELASITKTVQKDTPFPLHALDGHSESYSYDVYLDEEKARNLNKKIGELKSQINNYTRDAEAIRKTREMKEQRDKVWREDKISSTAKDIYDEQVNAYMKMNFWGKAKTMFAGKKPKKLNNQQIVQNYGNQAVEQIITPGVQEIMRQKEEQLASVKVTYANDPKMLENAIRATNQYFDTQLEQLQKTYDTTLTSVINKGVGR